MLALTFRNISNLAEVSDYEYQVLIGGEKAVRVIEQGVVQGHIRSDGWEKLVRKFLEERIVDNGE